MFALSSSDEDDSLMTIVQNTGEKTIKMEEANGWNWREWRKNNMKLRKLIGKDANKLTKISLGRIDFDLWSNSYEFQNKIEWFLEWQNDKIVKYE